MAQPSSRSTFGAPALKGDLVAPSVVRFSHYLKTSLPQRERKKEPQFPCTKECGRTRDERREQEAFSVQANDR